MSISVESGPGRARTRHLGSLFGPIADDLARSEAIFAGELASRHAFVQELVDHAGSFGGKRLRPALLLFTARACGGVRPDHHVLAAVVEMIHVATLVHDDILDEADVRRHLATVNARWDNRAAVLLGDHLFTHAFHLAASLETTRACRWIGQATNVVCEGEMIQIHHQGDLALDEATYMEIIAGKTAELVAVACRLGAHYAEADEATTEAMRRYGRNVGIAFQIADDVLDIWGDEAKTGKSLGTDLKQLKLTLPLIHLLRNGPPEVVDRVRSRLDNPETADRHELRADLEQTGSLEYAWCVAADLIQSAQAELERLPASPDQALLHELAGLVVHRAR